MSDFIENLKSLEDALLDNMEDINQFEDLKKSHNFQFIYYSDLNNIDNLREEIIRRGRDRKLNNLGIK